MTEMKKSKIKVNDFFTIKLKPKDHQVNEKKTLRRVTKLDFKAGIIYYNIIHEYAINNFEYNTDFEEIEHLPRDEYPEYYL